MSSGQVSTGEKITESPLTGHIYRVTKWKDLGDGKIRSIEKERIKFVVAVDGRTDQVFEWCRDRHEAVGIAAIENRKNPELSLEVLAVESGDSDE